MAWSALTQTERGGIELLGAPGADFIVDYTQVQQVNANTFNVVLVRNPYATIVAGDFVAVSAAPTSRPRSAGGSFSSLSHQKDRVSVSRQQLHGRRNALVQGWRMHCKMTQTRGVSVQALQPQVIMILHIAAVYVPYIDS